MSRFANAAAVLLLTLWVGALWAIGYIAAPVLFSSLDERVLAGTLAGRMFAVVDWLGLGCGSYLLLHLLVRQGVAAMKRGVFWCLLLMTALAAAQRFGLQPLIAQLRAESVSRELAEAATRSRFATWHGVASVLWLVQSVLGAAAVLAGGRAQK